MTLVTAWPEQVRSALQWLPLQVLLDMHPSRQPRGPLLLGALFTQPGRRGPRPLLRGALSQRRLRPVSRDTDSVQQRPELLRGADLLVHPPRRVAQVPPVPPATPAGPGACSSVPLPAGVGSPPKPAVYTGSLCADSGAPSGRHPSHHSSCPDTGWLQGSCPRPPGATGQRGPHTGGTRQLRCDAQSGKGGGSGRCCDHKPKPHNAEARVALKATRSPRQRAQADVS